MATWPAIAQPAFGTGGEVYKAQVRTEFEVGYVQSRARFTREIRRWSLKWNAMTEADFALLEAFFIANQGTSFTWTEPVTSTSYTTRFSGDSLQWSHADKGVRSVSVTIEEV